MPAGRVPFLCVCFVVGGVALALRGAGANRIMSSGFPGISDSYERGSQRNVLFPEAFA